VGGSTRPPTCARRRRGRCPTRSTFAAAPDGTARQAAGRAVILPRRRMERSAIRGLRTAAGRGPAAVRRKNLSPPPNASRILRKPLLVRDRMATGTRREQRAAPPRVSPEETRDGGLRKGPSGGAIPLPDVVGCISAGQPRRGGQGTVRSRPAGVGRRVDESRAVNAARGAAEAPHTRLWRRCVSAPLPRSLIHPGRAGRGSRRVPPWGRPTCRPTCAAPR
jgi:hypothetical protein